MVVELSHCSMGMGPGEKYNILSRDGVDRGRVTGHLPAGAPPYGCLTPPSRMLTRRSPAPGR
jgi:hypothetical protein